MAPETEPAQPTDEEPVMTPFSLADLGLSEEEIAALGIGETTPAELAAPAQEELPALEETSAVPEPEPAQPADEEPVMTPFSLADLGLSEEEIATLGIGETTLPEPAAPAQEELPALEEPSAVPEPAAPAHEELPTLEETSAVPEPTVPAQEEPSPIPEPVVTAPAARSRAKADAPPAASGHTTLDTYVRRLEEAPQNHMLRLSVARAGAQLGMSDFAVKQYRFLIKQNALLDQIADDLQDLLVDADDRQLLTRLHRTLGDVYTKQNRIAEAMDEYSWTPAGS
jgi:hypothetical protein